MLARGLLGSLQPLAGDLQGRVMPFFTGNQGVGFDAFLEKVVLTVSFAA